MISRKHCTTYSAQQCACQCNTPNTSKPRSGAVARTRDEDRDQQQQKPSKDLIVTYTPKEREVAPAPEEAPIIHSSSYILRERQGNSTAAPQRQSPSQQHSSPASSGASRSSSASSASGEEVSSGNAIEWALRQADSYFDRVENDEAARKSAHNVVSNPVTQTTLRTLQVRHFDWP